MQDRKPNEFVLMVNRDHLPASEARRRDIDWSLASEKDFLVEGAIFSYLPKDAVEAHGTPPESAIPLPLRLLDGRCLKIHRLRCRCDPPDLDQWVFEDGFEIAWRDDAESLRGVYTYANLEGKEAAPPLRTPSGLTLMVDRYMWFGWNAGTMGSAWFEIATPEDIGRKGAVFCYQDPNQIACVSDSTPDSRVILPLELPDGRELLVGNQGHGFAFSREYKRSPFGIYDPEIPAFSGVLSYHGREYWERVYRWHDPRDTGSMFTYDRFDRDADGAARERALRELFPHPVFAEGISLNLTGEDGDS